MSLKAKYCVRRQLLDFSIESTVLHWTTSVTVQHVFIFSSVNSPTRKEADLVSEEDLSVDFQQS